MKAGAWRRLASCCGPARAVYSGAPHSLSHCGRRGGRGGSRLVRGRLEPKRKGQNMDTSLAGISCINNRRTCRGRTLEGATCCRQSRQPGGRGRFSAAAVRWRLGKQPGPPQQPAPPGRRFSAPQQPPNLSPPPPSSSTCLARAPQRRPPVPRQHRHHRLQLLRLLADHVADAVGVDLVLQGGTEGAG